MHSVYDFQGRFKGVNVYNYSVILCTVIRNSAASYTIYTQDVS